MPEAEPLVSFLAEVVVPSFAIPPWPPHLLRSSRDPKRPHTRNMTKSTPIVLPALDNAAEKENQCDRNLPPLSPSAQHQVKSTAGLLPGGKRITTPLASYLSSASGVANTTSPARVLRLGETVESLFLLRPHSSEEYKQLCMQLVHDAEAAQDAKIWIQVLRAAMHQQYENGQDGDEDSRANLIRLHHRAMTRFVLAPDTLPIWLSYARAQAHQKEDALLTLRHAARVGSSTASFYMTKANLYCECWGDVEEGVKILQLGIQKNAQPIHELKARLDELRLLEKEHPMMQQEHSFNSRLDEKDPELDKSDVTERLNNMHCVQGSSPAHTSRSSNYHEQEILRSSRKRDFCDVQKIDALAKDMTPTDKRRRQQAPHQLGKSTVKCLAKAPSTRKRPPLVDSRLLQRTGADLFKNQQPVAMVADSPNRVEGPLLSEHTRFSKCDLSYIKTWDPEKGGRKSNDMTKKDAAPSPSTRELSSSNAPSPGLSGHSKVPEIIQSPRAQKPSIKLDVSYMKAWNPEPSRRKPQDRNSVDKNNATLTSEIPSFQSVAKALPTSQESSLHKAKKPPRIDMTYIQEWDPEKYRRGSITTPDPAKDKDLRANTLPSLASASGSAESGGREDSKPVECKKTYEEENPQTSTLRKGSPTTTKSNETVHKQDVKQINTAAEKSQESIKGVVSAPEQHDAPKVRVSLDEYNKDFLPLVHQDNMLSVNGISYAKMGIIGKGGSCKVYRALSKEGHVLAIKKVKLAGLQQKAIEGYANEIALLKRLRGNGAIIQMFDSQIDMPQKAIFLVMEAGEADLNHVLQQHLSNDPAGSSLKVNRDMNFIRLTWQQMLKAVHCIHEERIVHGDLKPANFLFVRGKLKLIDFGIAKTIQSDDTTNIYRDSQVGTINYMSPESLMNETGNKQWKMGRASDIWSLGCILYQMIYGKTPFADLHMIQKIQAIINPSYKISFPPTADDAAIDCMKQCLRYNADERPPIVGRHGLLNEHRFLNATN